MGEAKRRKKLDPNFGKSKHKIWITQSEMTNNHLIMINDYCFDSALKLEDAEKIADWLRKETQIHPLPNKFTEERMTQWGLKFAHNNETYPDAKAESFVLDPETGEMTSVITDGKEMEKLDEMEDDEDEDEDEDEL